MTKTPFFWGVMTVLNVLKDRKSASSG